MTQDVAPTMPTSQIRSFTVRFTWTFQSRNIGTARRERSVRTCITLKPAMILLESKQTGGSFRRLIRSISQVTKRGVQLKTEIRTVTIEYRIKIMAKVQWPIIHFLDVTPLKRM